LRVRVRVRARARARSSATCSDGVASYRIPRLPTWSELGSGLG